MRISSLRDGNQLCVVNHVDLPGGGTQSEK